MHFVDEAGMNINMAREYGYSLRGKRLFDQRPRIFARNHTILGSLSTQGIGGLMTVEGGTSSEVFFHFASTELLPRMEAGQVVVLDNLAAHKSDLVTELFEDHGIHVLHTPPYSPEWNPIELAWSKIKSYLRAFAARSVEELDKASLKAVELVTAQEAQNWIRHCGYRF